VRASPALDQFNGTPDYADAVERANPGDAQDDAVQAVLGGEESARSIGEGFREGEVVAHGV